ncbi:putative Ig domain-containing protein, partial [Puniceicoccaceae bacterium K14]|nr:putative Ig domain-containing protein [Puniceicoccaceae bacterium K14]
SWLSFNGSTFTGTPSSAPSSHSITVRASDPSGASVSASFALTVYEAPVSDPITVDPSPGDVSSRFVTLYGKGIDAELRKNAGWQFDGANTIRVGGSSNNDDSVGVFGFELPELAHGEIVTGAILSIHLERASGPSGDVDLYGLGMGTNAVEDGTLFYSGFFGGDSHADIWPLQSAFAKPNSPSGYVDSDASSELTSFITEQFLYGAEEGELIYFRLNPSISDESNYKFWEFSTANRSNYEPMLILEITSGLSGELSSGAIASPADRSIATQGKNTKFSLNESLRSSVLDENEVIWLSSLDGLIGSSFSVTRSGLSIGVHEITVLWLNKSGALNRKILTFEVVSDDSVSSYASSASDSGVTWFFDKSYLTGSFANGEKYVVAPQGVTITKITPGWDGTKNGAEVNPVGAGRGVRQGFDKRVYNTEYDASLNVADDLPLYLPANSSLVSSIGLGSVSSKDLWIDDVLILTVLSEEPPAHSFRPAYAGADKKIFGSKADLDFSFLQNLVHPADVRRPSGRLGNVLLDLLSQWQTSQLKTESGEHSYGRQIAYSVADASLWLNLDLSIAEKQPVLVDMIQRGIDVWGQVNSGVVFYPNGGHLIGRKMFLVFAGQGLNRPEIMEWVDASKHFVFQEDMQHFIVDQYTLSESPYYSSSHLGMPEWASNPIGHMDEATPEWNIQYRDVNGAPNIGIALAAEIMGMRDAWNYEPYFRYLEERFWPTEEVNRSNSLNEIYHFYADMWDMYKE